MKKNPAAVSLGSKGGKARSRKLSKARKIEIAKLGAKARIESLKAKDLIGVKPEDIKLTFE